MERISKVVPSVGFSILQGLKTGIICRHCAGVKTPASLRSLAFVARLKPCPVTEPFCAVVLSPPEQDIGFAAMNKARCLWAISARLKPYPFKTGLCNQLQGEFRRWSRRL